MRTKQKGDTSILGDPVTDLVTNFRRKKTRPIARSGFSAVICSTLWLYKNHDWRFDSSTGRLALSLPS